MERNFSQIFLLAPNASKIKQHVFQGMNDYETTLRKKSSDLTFLQAYNALEKYADICTHETAKGIIETALSDTRTGSDENGNITNKINPQKAEAEKAAEKVAEAEKAKAEAEKTKAEAEKTKASTEKAKVDTEKAKAEAEKAVAEAKAAEAEKAKAEAEKAKAEAEKAKAEAEKAKAEAEKTKAETEK